MKNWIQKAKNKIENSSLESSVYIGTDSVCFKKGYFPDGKSMWFARYATVVIVHKDSRHGCSVTYAIQTQPYFGQLKTRLLTEVQLSLDAYNEIENSIGPRYCEIHMDVNPDPKHASNQVAKEAIGWVKGMGLVPKIKDQAWAASTAADYCARGRL